MSDLYERLLAKVTEAKAAPPPCTCGDLDDAAVLAAADALLATLELHKPEPCGWLYCRSPDTHRVCAECGRVTNHPCPTVRAIARTLDVPTDQRDAADRLLDDILHGDHAGDVPIGDQTLSVNHVFASPEVLATASKAWEIARASGCDEKQAVALVADALWSTAEELTRDAGEKAMQATLDAMWPKLHAAAVEEVAHRLLGGAHDATWHQASVAARAEVGRWLLRQAGRPTP